MDGFRRALTFWCLGASLFWAIEAIINVYKGVLVTLSWHLFAIAGIYLALSIMGALVFCGINSLLSKFAKADIERDCFFIATFTFSLTFAYSFLWVNDKNPDTFFSRSSILMDIPVLFLSLIFSIFIYFWFIKRKENKDLFTAYLAYSISFDFFIIFTPYFNWRVYRESVWTLGKFLTFKTFLSNILIIGGCILLYFLLYNSIMFVARNPTLKKISKPAIITFGALIFVSGIVFLTKGNSTTRQLLFKASFNSQERPNVLIFLSDALRADHLGCYGYRRNTSPNIDKLSQSAVLFENYFTSSPLSELEIVSLFTSRYATFEALKNYKYASSLVRLQEILRQNGYRTAVFPGYNAPYELLALEKGIDYFFSQYGLFYEFFIPKAYITFLNAFTKDENAWGFCFDKMEDKLFSWLDENKENNFFVYVHSTDTHAPYRTSDTYKRTFYSGTDRQKHLLAEEWRIKQSKFPLEKVKDMIDIYDDAIRYTDENFGKIIRKLEELDILNQTLLVFVADHGEAFLEHGVSHHGRSVLDENIKVPLLIRCPKLLKSNERNLELVSTNDIVPTFLEILNVKVNQNLDGKSFLPLILKRGAKESEHRKSIFSGRSSYFNCIRTKRWKLVICDESKRALLGTGRLAHKELKELYDLEGDPAELNNIYSQKYNDEEILKLEKQLVEHIEMLKSLGQ